MINSNHKELKNKPQHAEISKRELCEMYSLLLLTCNKSLSNKETFESRGELTQRKAKQDDLDNPGPVCVIAEGKY